MLNSHVRQIFPGLARLYVAPFYKGFAGPFIMLYDTYVCYVLIPLIKACGTENVLSLWIEQEQPRPGGTDEPGQHSKCLFLLFPALHCCHQLCRVLHLRSRFMISSASWTPSCSVWATLLSWEITAWQMSTALTWTTTAGLMQPSWKVRQNSKQPLWWFSTAERIVCICFQRNLCHSLATLHHSSIYRYFLVKVKTLHL